MNGGHIRVFHILSNINENERAGNCDQCGYVRIYPKMENGVYIYRCNRIIFKPKKNIHTLTNICEKSKTAFCKGCGLVGIIWNKSDNYWRCNRAVIGGNTLKKLQYKKFKKDICETCGFVPENLIQLDVHHIDENKSNNNPENLKTLCQNCHILQHIKTYEELDSIRQAGLLQRRWDVILNPQNYPRDKWLENCDNVYNYSLKKKHLLRYICIYSRTAYCDSCGLVSIILGKSKYKCHFWTCNHGGRRSGYGKLSNRKADIERRFFRENKKYYCETCGLIPVHERQLAIHHKDENHSNNEIGNLETTCHNCHRLKHNDFKEKGLKKRIATLLNRRWLALINS